MKKIARKQVRSEVKHEMKDAIAVGVAYLQSHLPLKNKMLASLAFLSPKERKNPRLIQMAQAVMESLKRFDDEEIMQASAALRHYRSLSDDKVSKKDSRIDDYWNEIFSTLKEELSEDPVSLQKLVKIACSLAHSNAFVERGFSTTKMILNERQSLKSSTVMALKIIREEVMRVHGTENVTITHELLVNCRKSRAAYFDALKKEQDEKKKKEKLTEVKEQEKKKLKLFEKESAA